MKGRDLFTIAKKSFEEWSEDRAPNEAAALAYYTLLAVPAILLLIQWILGQVVSDQLQEQVINLVLNSIQGRGSEAITALIENADRPGSGGAVATVVSVVTLAVSASGVVVQLEQALNRMWDVAEAGDGFVAKIRNRAFSMLMVLLLGFFLVVSVLASTLVSGFAETLTGYLNLGEWSLQGINIGISAVLLILLFGTTLKVIPDAEVAWSDVWLGATVTAVLFLLGQYGLSIYLGKSAPGSAYGAAGSIVAFVVWIYYSALILFLGAEFTQVYANLYGSRIGPGEGAVPLEQKVVAEQARPPREPAADAGEAPEGVERAQPSWQATDRPLTGEGTRTPAAQERQDEGKTESYATYYTVAALALLVGIWRWLRRPGE